MHLNKLSSGGMKMESRETIAIEVFPIRSTIPCGRNIRLWTAFYLKHLHLPPVLRGLHQKVKPLLCENGVANQCHSFLRTVPLGKLTVDLFQQYIQEELFTGKRFSRQSVRRCLRSLGYEFMRHQQGVYFDDHERDDVRAHRKSFLEKIFRYEVLIDKYGGDGMMVTELPELAPGQQKHVLIVHDESLFYSNDDQGSM
jgi:hypothetical protein